MSVFGGWIPLDPAVLCGNLMAIGTQNRRLWIWIWIWMGNFISTATWIFMKFGTTADVDIERSKSKFILNIDKS